MARFIGVDREQVSLLPPSVCDWVPDAKARLQRQRQPATEAGGDEDDDRVEIDLDPRHFVTPPQGRRAWLREGRRALEAQRERQRRPIPNDWAERLFEACRRLERELDALGLASSSCWRWSRYHASSR